MGLWMSLRKGEGGCRTRPGRAAVQRRAGRPAVARSHAGVAARGPSQAAKRAPTPPGAHAPVRDRGSAAAAARVWRVELAAVAQQVGVHPALDLHAVGSTCRRGGGRSQSLGATDGCDSLAPWQVGRGRRAPAARGSAPAPRPRHATRSAKQVGPARGLASTPCSPSQPPFPMNGRSARRGSRCAAGRAGARPGPGPAAGGSCPP